jgi:hypothetical protein
MRPPGPPGANPMQRFPGQGPQGPVRGGMPSGPMRGAPQMGVPRGGHQGPMMNMRGMPNPGPAIN